MLATWIAFLLYAAAAISLGWVAHRRHEGGAAYWTAGRSLGATSVGLSISAGFLSVSWSCVYAVQLFYWYGLGAVWLITVPWIIALAGIYWLAGRYHDLPAFSQPEMVGMRFGKGARRIVALALAFVFLVWGGAEIYVAAILLAPMMGLSGAAMILLISLVVGIYATLGGFRAVVNTDKLQYTIVVLFILAMAWLAAVGLQDTSQTRQGVELIGAKSGHSWRAWLAPGLLTIVLTLAAYLPGWIFETDLWLRVQAARDARAARRGVLLAALNGLLFVGLLPMFIGIAALAIFPVVDGQFPPLVGNEGDAIFAALVQSYAPAWLQLVVAVGLVAAAMSTIDTCSNVMALSIAYDLFELHEKPYAGRASQTVTAASVAAACLFALNTESLWDIFYLSSGILTTTVAFPVAAVFLPRVKPRTVRWSAAAGFAGTTLAYVLESSGALAALQPAALTGSGLAFIFWGLLAAAMGALLGQISSKSASSASSRPA